jgi:hypothetical protein
MVTQVTSARKSVSFEDRPDGAARPRSRLAALLSRTDRAVTLNVGMLVLLAVWAIGEFVIDGTAYTLVAIGPATPFFAVTAYIRAQGDPALGWLRASGFVCGMLTLLCAASFYGSLVAMPVDVSCAVTSAIFGAVFAFGACYQLLRGGRDSDSSGLCQRR